MDKIKLTGIKVMGKHGVLQSEKDLGQPFIADVALFIDLTAAGESDDLRDTVHYGEIFELIEKEIGTTCYDLIEKLTYRLVGLTLAYDDRIKEVEVTLYKPNAPIYGHFDHASITVSRKREDIDLSEFGK